MKGSIIKIIALSAVIGAVTGLASSLLNVPAYVSGAVAASVCGVLAATMAQKQKLNS